MSMLADIQYDLSNGPIKDKLTLDERAQLLIDITQSLQWETYDLDSEGIWDGEDIEKAKKDLKQFDNEK